MKLTYILAIGVGLLTASCTAKASKPARPAPSVTDYVVEKSTLPVVLDFVGFAESSHPVEIRARVEGYLDTIAYEEGQLVKPGQLMFQLDPKQFQAKVAEAKGEVARQEAILENTNLTVARLTPLYAQSAASKKDLDNATSAQLAAIAAVEVAKANLLNAAINLEYTTIASPIEGYSGRAKWREGSLITPGQDGLLTTVSVLDPIWVYFTVSDTDILRIREQEAKKAIALPTGQGPVVLSRDNSWVVEAVLSDGSTFPHKGKVDFSAPSYDQSTGSLMARAVFPNPEAGLRPGQFVRVKVYGAERPEAIVVPQRALIQKKGGMFVYLIDAENKVNAQDVGTGDWYGDYQVVTDGLKVGDRIVADGTNKVRPGMVVNIEGLWKANADAKKSTTPDAH